MDPEPPERTFPAQVFPEQPKTTSSAFQKKSSTQFYDVIRRWQPMGFRVIIKLPYVADDTEPLFAIRVGPYICPNSTSPVVCPVFPLPGGSSARAGDPVVVHRYGANPPLAVAAMACRGWVGSMKYRLRCVSNFVSSGYIIAGTLKGAYSSEWILPIDFASKPRPVWGLADGYDVFMQNSYVLSDTSMFRHIEVDVPYEYPLPWYDQQRALGEFIYPTVALGKSSEINCPDNYIVVSARGTINSPDAGAELVYELEYAAGDDFEFFCEGWWSGSMADTVTTFTYPESKLPAPVLANDVEFVRSLPTEQFEPLSTELNRLKRTKSQQNLLSMANMTLPTNISKYNE